MRKFADEIIRVARSEVTSAYPSREHSDLIAETSLCRNVVISSGPWSARSSFPPWQRETRVADRSGGAGQPGLGNLPLPAASAAERPNELGRENAAMAAYAGLWDVTETVWDKPGGKPVTTTGLVAERR